MLIRWIFILLVSTCGVVGFGGCIADRMLLYPSTNPIDAHGAQRRMIEVADRRWIEVWIARSSHDSSKPNAFVLEFTGNGTRAEQIATWAASRWDQHNVELWEMNFPGYGGSTGPARLRAIARDATRVFDQMKSQSRGKPIFLAGNSLGTTAALYVAAHRPVAGIYLQSVPPLRQTIMGHHGWWNLWLLALPVSLGVPDDLDAIANAQACRAPAVFVTLMKDDLVPPKFQQMVIDAYAGPKRALSYGGGHNDSPDIHAADMTAAIEWLWSQGGN